MIQWGHSTYMMYGIVLEVCMATISSLFPLIVHLCSFMSLLMSTNDKNLYTNLMTIDTRFSFIFHDTWRGFCLFSIVCIVLFLECLMKLMVRNTDKQWEKFLARWIILYHMVPLVNRNTFRLNLSKSATSRIFIMTYFIVLFVTLAIL